LYFLCLHCPMIKKLIDIFAIRNTFLLKDIPPETNVSLFENHCSYISLIIPHNVNQLGYNTPLSNA
jgi:hypothetical protein